jgi:hypothetical protein
MKKGCRLAAFLLFDDAAMGDAVVGEGGEGGFV